ncbi:MAG: NAD(P)-dependent glycerol-3-phosphate dehydrogenase [Candidatus Delongbacteria bacterium]|nr:NAD(P)-dependent glycerol-3-phosphate dehydrogenase [Candidatus Delongbacteria bacterium]MBN2834234.1 NAD(P)-dependent glycerol-3-phosphate dehydrogenase [Candidatus Delongbacteria bacterium]
MKIAVLGAGAWGMSMAYLLFENGHDVYVWEFSEKAVQEILQTRELKGKLDGFKIPEKIIISSNINYVMDCAEVIVNAVPTQFIRGYFNSIKEYDFSKKILVNVSKGIEASTGEDIRTIFLESFETITDDNFVILAGPSFANEVTIKRSPTTVVSACKNIETANKIRDLFSSKFFRVYSNSDVIGVEIGGSIKNIIAIAAGIHDGMDLGNNSKAALLTRGLAEMTRFGVKMGAKRETFSGLTGIGDMILTCNSILSRNYQVGFRIGKGERLNDILASMTMVAEGVETARIARKLSLDNEVEMPITEIVYEILFNDVAPQLAVPKLMLREKKEED